MTTVTAMASSMLTIDMARFMTLMNSRYHLVMCRLALALNLSERSDQTPKVKVGTIARFTIPLRLKIAIPYREPNLD